MNIRYLFLIFLAISCANPSISVEVNPEFNIDSSSDSSANARNQAKLVQEISEVRSQLSDLNSRPSASLAEFNEQQARLDELESMYARMVGGLSEVSKTFKIASTLDGTGVGAHAGYFISDDIELTLAYSWNKTPTTTYSYDDGMGGSWYSVEDAEYTSLGLGVNYYISKGFFKPYVGAYYAFPIEGDMPWNAVKGNDMGLRLGSLIEITDSFFFDAGLIIPITTAESDYTNSWSTYDSKTTDEADTAIISLGFVWGF
jgi:hypothetical protein